MTLYSRLYFCTAALLTFSTLLNAQEQLRGINAMPRNEDAISAPLAKSQQSVNLPFVDDFSYEGNSANPNLWEPSDVWVNQTWAKNAITLGFATFDGLNRFGRPYSYVGNDSVGDILESREINLGNPTDSVYFSFYYQAGGWGELPGAGDDSLTLQFWNGKDSTWRAIWRNDIYPKEYFKQVMIYVDTAFHRNDFRFRFRNYGTKRGALDIWHVDYIRLDDQRTLNDSVPEDISFTRPYPSLMVNYESIPWWHVNETFNVQNFFKPAVDLHYRRNWDAPDSINLNLGLFQVSYSGNQLQQHALVGPGLASGHPDNQEVQYTIPPITQPQLNFINPPYPDEFEIESFQTFTGRSNDIPSNDTIFRKQVFKNYYAYDDGSAERAYEIRNNRGGFIVQRYDVLVDDTLKGLQIYFQPALYDLDDQEFTILMLSNSTGLPSSIIYESDSVYTAQYTGGNFYQTYLLDTTIVGPVSSGTVFIGIRQQNSDPLSIGYDQNSRNRTTAFYGELDDMYQSFLGGSIMMRPVFRYIPRDFSLVENEPESSFWAYPNPSSGPIKLQLPAEPIDLAGYELRLYNLQGQVVARQSVSTNWDLPNLPSGLYIIRLEGEGARKQWQSKIQIR